MKYSVTFAIIVFTFFPFTSCKSQKSDNTNTTSTLVSGEIVHLTASTFKTKVFDYQNEKTWKFKGNKPCVIDFYASWCGPCKMLAPTVKQVAQDYAGKIDVYKVDTDAEQELAYVFGISSIPSLLFCPKDGQPRMISGLINRTEFDKIINDELLKTN